MILLSAGFKSCMKERLSLPTLNGIGMRIHDSTSITRRTSQPRSAIRSNYEGLFQRLYARPSRRSPVRIRKVPSLARLHSAHSDESAESSPFGLDRSLSAPAVSLPRSKSRDASNLRGRLFSVDVDSSLHSAGSLSDDRHSRIWHDWKADQKADTVAKPASIRTSDTCEERAPIDASVLAAWQMFYCGGSAPGVHAQKCSHNPGKSQAARESAQSCYVV